MKKLSITLIILIILGMAGYFGYQKIKSVAANKLIDQVATNLSQEDLNKLKQAHSDSLIKTKEDAISLVSSKLSASDIKELVSMAADGFTDEEESKIKNEFKDKFTPNQLVALEEFAYQELHKSN